MTSLMSLKHKTLKCKKKEKIKINNMKIKNIEYIRLRIV